MPRRSSCLRSLPRSRRPGDHHHGAKPLGYTPCVGRMSAPAGVGPPIGPQRTTRRANARRWHACCRGSWAARPEIVVDVLMRRGYRIGCVVEAAAVADIVDPPLITQIEQHAECKSPTLVHYHTRGTRRYRTLCRYSSYPGKSWRRKLSSSRMRQTSTGKNGTTRRTLHHEPSASGISGGNIIRETHRIIAPSRRPPTKPDSIVELHSSHTLAMRGLLF